MTTPMDYAVDIESPIAVYIQIENQIQFAIASGKVGPGDTLPSVREMSSVLKVNPNTVTKAYRDLELMGLVQTRRGVGVSVAEKAPKICRDKVQAMVRDHLRVAVAECVASGVTTADVRTVVSDALAAGGAPYSPAKRR